jgi:hypothetical protein
VNPDWFNQSSSNGRIFLTSLIVNATDVNRSLPAAAGAALTHDPWIQSRLIESKIFSGGL